MRRGDTKDYSSPEKVANRQKCIIDTYKELTGNVHIPSHKDYITLSNYACDEHGVIIKDREYDQVLNANLCTPEQFIGIDRDSRIVDINKRVLGNWICGDFSRSVASMIPKSNPAVINYDSTCFPYNATEDLRDILITLKLNNIHECMVSYTGILKYRYKGFMSDIVNGICQHPMAVHLDDIECSKDTYIYGSPVLMGTIWFYVK